MRRPDLRHLEAPAYFHALLGRFCRTACALDMMPDNATHDVRVPEGSLVAVVAGEYVDPPGDEDDHFRMTVVLCRPSGRRDPSGASYDGAADSMLELDPSMPRWSAEDSRRATAEGWDVFERDCPNDDGEYFEVQSWENRRFRNDTEAHEHVWCWAVLEDSPLHQRALAFVRAVSPREYRRIRRVGRKAIAEGRAPTP